MIHIVKLNQITMEKEIIFNEEVMELTGYTRSTIYSKVSRQEIPTFVRGRPLVFKKSQILKWLEAGRPTDWRYLFE